MCQVPAPHVASEDESGTVSGTKGSTSPDLPGTPLRLATYWSYALSLGKMAISLGLAFVLAALLGPRAFGVIGMALVFINFVEMLQQQGLMPAIVTRTTLTARHADTAFWLVTVVGLACTGAAIGLAPWWAELNGLPELAPVIRILAVTVPVTSTVVVHEALLRRELAFKKLTVRTWVSLIAGGIAGVLGAVLGLGVWALVLQQVVTSVVAVIVLWTVSPWRPRFRVDFSAARELFSYSTRAATSSLGLFVGGRVDVLLAGLFFGPVVVGLYRLAERITSTAVDVTARGMQAVALPGLSGVQDNSAAFVARLLRMQRITSLMALPLLGLLVGAALPLERTLGPQWEGTAAAIRLLAIMQAFTAISLLLGPALQARNRPGTLSIVIWISSGLKVLGLVSATWLAEDSGGLVALCLVMIAATAMSSIVIVAVAVRILRIRLVHIVSAWVPGGVGAVVAVAFSWCLVWILNLPSLLELAIGGFAGSIAAGLAMFAISPDLRAGATNLRVRLRRRASDVESPHVPADQETTAIEQP